MNRKSERYSHKTASTVDTKEDEEIEYNITFPSSCNDNDAKEPVVYLLGWWGSTDKILSKYSEMYEKIGCVTIRYIHQKDTGQVFKLNEEHVLMEVGDKLCQLLEDYDLSANPVLIHSFSNTGGFAHYGLIKSLTQNNINIIGTVFDSGPARRDFLIVFNALYQALNSNIIYFALACIPLLTSACYTLIRERFTGNYIPDVNRIICSSKESWKWPSLFLYSSGDPVCPSEHITCMASKRKELGAAFVRQYNFISSGHVNHFRHHKELYERLCSDFIEDCLSIYDGEDIKNVLRERELCKESSVDFIKDEQPSGSKL